METTRYCHSDNEETFSGDHKTIEGAIAEALDEYEDAETVYVGEAKKRTIGDFLNSHHVESLLESLAEAAYEEHGDIVGDWLQDPTAIIRKRDDETVDEYRARVAKRHQDKKARVAPLQEDIRAALEKWATDHGEQPGFFGVSNIKSYSREEAERISKVTA